MPIYEYRCDSCGHELEAMQKIADDPLTDCPACSQPALKKKISAVGFRLKGSGWYETDFKTDKKKNLADGGDKKPEKSSDSKSDSKKNDSTSKSTAAKSGGSDSASSGKSGNSNKAA